ncbi:hypothetical protein F183_A52710 [Bryobacterales bacterium F-183]|nr:hypothetical protein F183_A52710 [Bryobacterales bacterium F-183]
MDLQIAGTTRGARITEDASGNLYFAGVNLVYKVTTSGFVTRFAGTGWSDGSLTDGALARDSRLSGPNNPSIGPNGRLYFAETAPASRMRNVDLNTGLIQTVPFQATAQAPAFTYPFIFDVSGVIYYANGTNIYSVNPNTGAQTSLANVTGTVTDLAIDAVGNLFLLDGTSGGPLLRQLNIQSLQVSTLINAAPQGVAYRRVRFLSGGDFLFIGSTVDRYLSGSSTFQRLAGALNQTPASDGASVLSAGFGFRDALYRAGTGELVVLFDGLAPLWRVEQGSGLYRPIVINRSPAYTGSLPLQSLIQGPDDNGTAVLYAPPAGGLALEVPGAFLSRIASANTSISYLAELPATPYTLSADPSGNYYARAAFIARRPAAQTSFEPFITPRPDNSVSTENTGIGTDWYGTPIAATNLGRFYRWNGGAWIQTGAISNTQQQYTTGRLRTSPDGRIYYLSASGITRFDPASGTAETVVATGAFNPNPGAFDLDSSGYLYYAGPATPYSTLYRRHPFSGTSIAIAGGGTSREPSGPALSAQIAIGDIAVDRVTGDVYFREAMLPQIRVVTGVAAYNGGAAVSISPSPLYVFASAASNVTVRVTASGSWQAGTDQPWITLTPSSNTVLVNVTANTALTSRSGNVQIGDATLRIIQEGTSCGYAILPQQRSYSSEVEGFFTISTASTCRWSVLTRDTWITPLGAATGSGTATIRYNLAPNATSALRRGEVSVDTIKHTVYQDPASFASLTRTGFVPLPPCRIADTREANGTYGGPFITGGTTRVFPLNGRCGLTGSARAVALNITAVPRSSLGYMTVWGEGTTVPVISTLNALDGRIKANAAIVSVGASGDPMVRVFANNDTDVIVDVSGYFTESTSDLAFYPVTPCRISDSRNANGPFGGPILSAGATRTIPVRQSACGIPATAQAYALNATVVPPAALGYLTLYPTGQALPQVSTLNALTGTVVANGAIVPAGTDGSVNAFVSGNTHLILDITGYFAPPGQPGALRYVPTAGCRILDTRLTRPQPLPAGSSTTVETLLAGCPVSGLASVVSLNATVLPSNGPMGYLTLFPADLAQPLVSTLNALDGAFTSNAAIVPVRPSWGTIQAFVSGATHMLLDVNGYFIP